MAGQDNWRASGSGRAIYFDGTDDFVTCPRSFTMTPPCSFLCWFRPDGAQISLSAPVFTRTSGNIAGFNFNAGTTMNISWNGQYFNNATGITITQDQWNFAAVNVLTSGYVLYWTAGTTLSSFSTTGVSNPAQTFAPLEIGKDNFSTRRFKGWIDDVRFYNRTLTLAEIRLLASRRGIGLTPGGSTRATYPTRFQIRIGGTWQEADAFTKVAGVWQPAKPSIKVAGVWK
jgi:hypothetical protein